ncbi:hypothetical protein AB0392_37870 [Nonomuraea angiospora]|uniref:hypothetical protein n=1 Tax=Nonomuraea angiospora TaxID=46172 RepID=UPI00344EFF21
MSEARTITKAEEWAAALAAARRRTGSTAEPLLDGLTILRVDLREAEDILRGIFGRDPTTLSLSEHDEGVDVRHADAEFIAELRAALRAEGREVGRVTSTTS